MNRNHDLKSASLKSTKPVRGGMREVVALAIPVVLTNLSITLMQMVDSAMVGRLGAAQLAAVGLGGIWLWTLMCFFIGTVSAVQVFVAQRYGSGDFEDCGSWAWQAIYALIPIGVAITVLVFLGAEWLAGQLDPGPSVHPHFVDYLRMRALGNAGLVGSVALASFFRGLGDTRTPLYATVVANIVNAVLDYGLIFGKLGMPEWGVLGAGFATSLAEWLNFALLAAFFVRRATRLRFGTAPVRPSRDRMRRLMRTGLPVGGQWWLEMTSFAAFMTLVARMGDAHMAASQAFIVLLAFSFMQAQGIGLAVSTLVGQYIGAGDLESAARSFRSGLRLCVAYTSVFALVYIAFPTQLLAIFSEDARVIALGVPLLWVGSLFQVFDAMAIVTDGALRGAGDTRWPMVIRFVLAWGLFVPLAYTFGVVLEGGLTWSWVGGIVYVMALTAILIRRFQSGRWKTITI